MPIPTHVNKQLPPPANWQDFEKLSRDLWAAIWGDENTQLNGRSGQKQHGVDVYVCKNGRWHGVQCKGKDSRYGGQVTETELRAEVEKAKGFTPPLTSFTLATTGQDDAAIQRVAREITAAHHLEGLFSVHVIGWDQIVGHLGTHDRVLAKHYAHMFDLFSGGKGELEKFVGDIAKVAERDETQIVEPLTELNNRSARVEEKLDRLLSAQTYGGTFAEAKPQSDDEGIDVEIGRKLDVYRDLITSSPSTALDRMQAIAEEHWDDLGEHIRFRLLTNIGACHMEQANFAEAGKHFRQAFPLGQRDSERATRNMALAHLMADEFEDAKAMAERAIDLNPDEVDSYSVLVAAAIRAGETRAPEDLVPSHLRATGRVCFSISRAYEHLGDQEASIRWLREGLKKEPTSNTVRASLGTALIARALDGKLAPIASTMTATAITDLREGAELIKATWLDVRSTELAPSYAWSVVNLCAALGALGRNDEVPTYVHQLEAVSFDKPELRKVAALVAMDQDDSITAERLLRAVPDGDKDAEIAMMHAQCLAALDRFDEALELVELAISRTDDQHSIVASLGFKVRILGLHKGAAAATQEADQALTRFPDDPTLLANLSEFHRREGNYETAIELALKAADKCTEDSETVTRLAVADALFELQLWMDALPIYSGLVQNYSNTPQFRRLLICQLNTDQRKAALENLAKVRPEILEDDFFLRIRTSLYVRSGHFTLALSDAEQLISRDPDDLEMRICWLGIKERLGDVEDVRMFLQNTEAPNSEDPDQLIRFAHWLARFGCYQVALDTAYRARRENCESSRTHLHYMGLFFQSLFPSEIFERTEVGIDCAFRIRRESGEQKTYIIDDRRTNDVFPGEIGSDHPIAQAALGKQVGETFDFEINQYQSILYEIVAIVPKYLHIFDVTKRDFKENFPGNQSFFEVDVAPKDDSEQINADPIFRVLDERKEHIEYIESVYANNPMPISMLAVLAGVEILDAWPGFMSLPQITINCALGTTNERDQAVDNITKNDSGYVLEPYSLFSIVALGIQETLSDAFGEFTVTQSTIDLYDAHILNHERMPSKGSMTKVGDEYVMDSMTEERREAHIRPFKETVTWAKQNCRIVPAIEDLPPSWHDLGDELHPAFVDSALAAKAEGAILVTDDMVLRSLALQDAGVPGVWLQPLLMVARERNKISYEAYCQSVVALADAGLNFISLDGGCLYWSVADDDDELSGRSKSLLNQMTKPTVELPSSFRVCAEFLLRLWHSDIPKTKAISATHQLLTSYMTNLPDLISRLAWAFWKKAQMWNSDQSEACQDAIKSWSANSGVPLRQVKSEYERRFDEYRQLLLATTNLRSVRFPR